MIDEHSFVVHAIRNGRRKRSRLELHRQSDRNKNSVFIVDSRVETGQKGVSDLKI